MFDRFSESARRVLMWARFEASTLGTGVIEPEHLFLGLCREAKPSMEKLGFGDADLAEFREQIEEALPRRRFPVYGDMPLSESAIRVIATANSELRIRGGRKVTPEHLLIGLAQQQDTLASRLLCEKSGGASV